MKNNYMKGFAVLPIVMIFFFAPYLNAQNLILTEIDSIPVANGAIVYSKFSGDDLYTLIGGRIWKKPYQSDWVQLPLDTSLTFIRSFDVNAFGQIIAIVDSTNIFNKKLLTTDDDFQTYEKQEALDGSLNYVAKDTIVLTSGRCGDIARDYSRYSIDGGKTWTLTNFSACSYSPDYKRVGNMIHWYGNFGSMNSGPGSPSTLYSHQRFSLDDFIGTSTVYSANANYTDRFNYIINDNGSKYINQWNFDRDTLYDVESYYANTLEGNLAQVGEGPLGTLRNGPKGHDVFLINNAFENSKIYYKENPQDDYIELTTNIDSIGGIRNILYANDKIYFVGSNKVYASNGIGFYNQKINGNIYYDLNDNCRYEVGIDSLVEDVVVGADLSDGSSFTMHVHNGQYEFLAPLGENEITINNIDNEIWGLCQSNSLVALSTSGENRSVDFGLTPIKECNDLDLDVVTYNLTRCFNNLLLLKAENLGTEVVENVNLVLTLDSLLELNSMDRNYVMLSEDKFSIEIGDLNVSQEAYVHVDVAVSCDSELGYTHCIDLEVETQNACNSELNRISECAPNVGSYDPNDIQLFNEEGRLQINFVEDEYFYYKIRFQNTGTAQAYHVRVTNEVPVELDLSSFELLSSSHDGQVAFSQNGVMEMRFDNINLPDSTTNFLESQGYLKYRIKPVVDISEGTEIFNEASIYFDFNEPVLTNESYGVIAMPSSTEYISSKAVKIFPNPSSGLLNINHHTPHSILATVVDMMGRTVLEAQVNNDQINVGGLPAGTYVLKLEMEQGHHNQVFVIR